MSRFGKKKKQTATILEDAAVLYVRVSSEEQVENMSLDTQTKACTRWCKTNGKSAAKVFREEGETAKTANRPALLKMLGWLKDQTKRPGYVIVYDLKRYCRNVDDHRAIRRRLADMGVMLRSTTEQIDETSTGKFNETIHAAVAQLDNDLRSDRTTDGMREATSRGRWIRKAPRGYRHREGKVVIDEKVAPVIRLAFEQAAAGVSVDLIRVELAKRGVKLQRSAVYEMLRNPFYLGRVVSPRFKLDVKGEHPPLIDTVTFHRASRARGASDGNRAYVTGSTPDFPLRVLTECEGCSRGVSGYFARGKSGKRWPYYRCPACHRNMAAGRLEDSFTTMLSGMAVPEPVLNLFEAQLREREELALEGWSDAQAGARQRIATARRHLEKLLPLLLAETIDSATYVGEKTRLQAAIDADEELLKGDPGSRIEPLLALARPILQTPILIWDSTLREARVPLVKGLFPAGLRWTKTNLIEPRGKCLLHWPRAGLGAPSPTWCPRPDKLSNSALEVDFISVAPWLRQLADCRQMAAGG